jgi:hypothetical protein
MAMPVHPSLESGDIPKEGLGNLPAVREARDMVCAGSEEGG